MRKEEQNVKKYGKYYRQSGGTREERKEKCRETAVMESGRKI
jgi:hypothetical protein